MRSQNCYNFLGPIVAISGKRKKKKNSSFSQTSERKLNIQISVNIFMLTWEATIMKYPSRTFWIQIFSKLKQNEAIMGFWKVLTICLPKQYAVSNLSYFTQIFYSKVRLQCAFIHGGNHLSGTAELVETSEI